MKYESIQRDLYYKSPQKENEADKESAGEESQSKKHSSLRTNSSTPAPEFISKLYKPHHAKESSIHSFPFRSEELCCPYELEGTQSTCEFFDYKKLSRYFQLNREALGRNFNRLQKLD